MDKAYKTTPDNNDASCTSATESVGERSKGTTSTVKSKQSMGLGFLIATGYCGKVFYLVSVSATLVACCGVLSLRAQIDMEDLILDRATENKRNQMLAVGLLMDEVAAAMQDSTIKEQTLVDLAAVMNRKYLMGSYEVILVRLTVDSRLHVLTDPRLRRECPKTGSEGRTVCDMTKLTATAVQVMHQDEGVSGNAVIEDYTGRDAIVWSRRVRNTSLGMLFKQDKADAFRCTDTLSDQKWYGTMLTYVSTAVVLFWLSVFLRQVQEGKGYLYMTLLCAAAVLGFVGILLVMAQIAGIDEGSEQQQRETADTTGVLLAAFRSLWELSAGSDDMYTAITRHWIDALDVELPSSYAVALLQTQAGQPVVTAGLHVCTGDCLLQFAALAAAAASERLDGSSAVELGAWGVHYLSAGYEASTKQSVDTRFTFVSVCSGRRVSEPHEALVADLWGRTAALCVGYVAVACLASLITCTYLPRTEAADSIPLNRALPCLVVFVLAIPFLVLVSAGAGAVDDIDKQTAAFTQVAYSTSVHHHAAELQALYLKLQSHWLSYLVAPAFEFAGASDLNHTHHGSEELVAATIATIKKKLGGLADELTVLEGDAAALVPRVVRGYAGVLEEFAGTLITPPMALRSRTVIEANASLLLWTAAPDSLLGVARAAIADIHARILAEGFSPASNEAAVLFALDTALYELEATFRTQVVAEDAAAFYSAYGNLSASLASKIDEFLGAVAKHVKSAEEAGSPVSLDAAKVASLVDKVKSNVDLGERDFSRFAAAAGKRDAAGIGDVIAASVRAGGASAGGVELLTAELEAATLQVPLGEFFAIMAGQLERVQHAAAAAMNRRMYLPSQFAGAKRRAKRTTAVGVVVLLATLLTMPVSLVLYLRRARCNAGPRGWTLVPYPWIEMRDNTVVISVVGLVFLVQLVVIQVFAIAQFDDLRDSERELFAVGKAAEVVSSWNSQTGAYLGAVTTFVLTGDDAERVNALDQFAEFEKLGRIGSAPLDEAERLLGGDPAGLFASAVSQSLAAAEAAQAAIAARIALDQRYGGHEYEALRFIVRDRLVNPELVEFMSHMAEEEKLTFLSSDAWLESYSEEWKSVELTARLEGTDKNGQSRYSWTPRAVSLTAGWGYVLVFKNELETAPVELGVESLLSSCAIESFKTRDSEWDLPYARSITLSPASTVTARVIVTQKGTFELLSGGAVAVTVSVEGPAPSVGLNMGLSEKASERARDARSSPAHPLWAAAEEVRLFLPLTGGFHPGSLDLRALEPYRLTIHNDGEACRWQLHAAGRYCSADLSVDLASDMPFDECAARAAVHPRCGKYLVANGKLCRCLLRGRVCDYQLSREGNDVYFKTCGDDLPDGGGAAGRASRSLDLSHLEGHVVWKSVEDQSCVLGVPSVRAAALRFDEAAYTERAKGTTVSFVPVQRGRLTVGSAAPEMPGELRVSDGCFLHTSAVACYADFLCSWDGATCGPTRGLGLLARETQSAVPSNVWNRLRLQRAGHALHASHLAYIISNDEAFLAESVAAEKSFLGNLSLIRDLPSTFRDEYEAWMHALDVERHLRSELSGAFFLEDVFKLEAVAFGSVWAAFAGFADLHRAVHEATGVLVRSSPFHTRCVFWSCSVVAWLFAAACALLLTRLDMAVRLSKPYSFHNVSARPGTADDLWSDESGEESTLLSAAGDGEESEETEEAATE
ncbi:hypothetical protein DIPPA_16335 [Diplonema papillatum]|nr:hypothetical protein DIPPA_16335 [Diplonema papillatum]